MRPIPLTFVKGIKMKTSKPIIINKLELHWLRLDEFCSVTGDTPNAVRCRISRGVWKKGEIVKTINRRIHVNLIVYNEYCNDYNEKLAA